jgi:hypothetical protein
MEMVEQDFGIFGFVLRECAVFFLIFITKAFSWWPENPAFISFIDCQALQGSLLIASILPSFSWSHVAFAVAFAVESLRLLSRRLCLLSSVLFSLCFWWASSLAQTTVASSFCHLMEQPLWLLP